MLPACQRRVVDRLGRGRRATVLDVEPDELHIALGRQLNKSARGALDALGVKLPFL